MQLNVPKKLLVTILATYVFSVCCGNAEGTKETRSIIVYGDSSSNWIAHVERVGNLVAEEDRPLILNGTEASPKEHASLAWFGDLSYDESELADLPQPLRDAVMQLGEKVALIAGDLPNGRVEMGVNCFNLHVDGQAGLPSITVSFSGDDPQNVCKGYTIAHLLLSHADRNGNFGD